MEGPLSDKSLASVLLMQTAKLYFAGDKNKLWLVKEDIKAVSCSVCIIPG